MIQVEFFKQNNNGTKLYRTYSDQGLKIQKTGTNEIYDEAIDIENSGYSYVETNEYIQDINEEENDVQQKAMAYDIIIGGIENDTN